MFVKCISNNCMEELLTVGNVYKVHSVLENANVLMYTNFEGLTEFSNKYFNIYFNTVTEM